jgi:ABC-type polysaccharide/polyol phosphate export permease
VLIATGSIVNNQGLIKKVYIPKILFPLASVLARFIDHLVLTAVLFVFMAVFRMSFTWNLLLIPLVMLMIFFFSLGLSLMAAVFYVKVRDVEHVLAILFQAFFYLSPIIYPLEILPAGFQKVFLLNPFYYFVQSFRAPFYSAQFPPGGIFWTALALTVIVFAVGLGIFYKREKYFVFNLS